MYRRDPLSTVSFASLSSVALRPVSLLRVSLQRATRPALVALACAVTLNSALLSTAHAQNLGFMHDSPIAFMKQKDMASLHDALSAALDKSADGQTTEWSNTGLGNSVPITATITPKDAVQDGGMNCRHVAVQLNARNQQQNWQPLFCKSAQGWKIQKR
jgi:surface antigen